MKYYILPCLILLIFHFSGKAQEDSSQFRATISAHYFTTVRDKSKQIAERMDKKSLKVLSQMQNEEEKIFHKLWKIDSLAAKNIFADFKEKYNQAQTDLLGSSTSSVYLPHLDTLLTSFKFLSGSKAMLEGPAHINGKLDEAVRQTYLFKENIAKAEALKKFIKERKEFLMQQLKQYDFAHEILAINKKIYYYSVEIKEYKELFQDPRKAERKALDLLSKTRMFQEFMKKNGMLASMFQTPVDPNNPSLPLISPGLQSRAQVSTIIQASITAGGVADFRTNLKEGQAKLNDLKNRVIAYGGNNSSDEMPSGFKPKELKTKNFWQRLELGVNIQTQKARQYFPVTSDIAFSAGYKITAKSVIGIGLSYRIGLGTSWKKINFSNEGVGLRSYIDWKIKGSFWLSGGYEQNYRSSFSKYIQLRDLHNWQQSGLLGINKTMSLKTKIFKKASVRLLWDFMSYQQIPRTQPLTLRVGYNF